MPIRTLAAWVSAACVLGAAALGGATTAGAQDPGGQEGAGREPAPPPQPALVYDLDNARVVSVGLGVGAQRTRSDETPTAFSRHNVLQGVARFAAFFRPEWAVDLSIARYGLVDDDAVVPVLLGAAYYPRTLAVGATLRPYASLAGGVMFRQYSGNVGYGALDLNDVVDRQRASRGDPAPGARGGVGVDTFVGRRLVIGGFAGYYVSGPFSNAAADNGARSTTRATGLTAWISVGAMLPRRGR